MAKRKGLSITLKELGRTIFGRRLQIDYEHYSPGGFSIEDYGCRFDSDVLMAFSSVFGEIIGEEVLESFVGEAVPVSEWRAYADARVHGREGKLRDSPGPLKSWKDLTAIGVPNKQQRNLAYQIRRIYCEGGRISVTAQSNAFSCVLGPCRNYILKRWSARLPNRKPLIEICSHLPLDPRLKFKSLS